MLLAAPRICTLLLLLTLGAASLAALNAPVDAAIQKEIQDWRAKHEASYRKEYVVLAGLFFLSPGENTAGSAATNAIVLPESVASHIGRFILDGVRVRFEPASGSNVTLKGKPVTSAIELQSDGNDAPDELEAGGVAFWVHESGARRAIRLRDEHGEIARGFAGFHWFPIDESYRVTARFIKDPAPREVHTPNLSGDDEVMTTEGVVEFNLKGQTVRLRPVTTEPRHFWFIFRDGTSGKETYETARFLYADLRDDGTTILDFNEAYNPPCAFNPYTTCPLPLKENRLKVRIPVGEKAYPKHP